MTEAPPARFEFVRVERAADIPARDPLAVDVAVLDMNHGLPNVGHHAIVALVREVAREQDERLADGGRRVRVLSYAVRHRLMVPEHDGRHRLYLGTGGPGHLDPRRNREDRGEAEIREDPSWEAPLWRLFDAIVADESTALYGVCHTFGLLCRWSGAAQPVLRGDDKGGKMTGVGIDVLTPDALAHPWFGRLREHLPDGNRAPVLESRYYDLVPAGTLPAGATAIAFEAALDGAGTGDAMTMVEFARDRATGLPRVFAVNNHPEIGAADRVSALLADLLARGAMTPEVFAARSAILPTLREDRAEHRLLVGRTVLDDLVRAQLERILAGT